MVIGKIKPSATIVAQFAAGVEIEAIQHEGKMFLPVMGLGEFASNDSIPKPSKEGSSKSESKDEGVGETTKYTEEQLMDMDSKVLLKLLKDEYGVNPDDYDGKNTNKKLRTLVLQAQDGELEEIGEEEEEEEKESPKKPSKAKEEEEEAEETEENDLVDSVADLLEDFDAGKKNRKKTISAIIALTEDDIDEDKVTDLVSEFEEDADADIEEVAQKIADVLEGKEEKKPAKKPARKSKGKKSEDEDLVDVDDLEVGDAVSVWWDDDNKDWFDGEVKSIKKGKVTIKYDDGTEEVIDPEVHTKIKRLAE